MTFAPQAWDREPDSCTYLLWAIEEFARAMQDVVQAVLTWLKEVAEWAKEVLHGNGN